MNVLFMNKGFMVYYITFGFCRKYLLFIVIVEFGNCCQSFSKKDCHEITYYNMDCMNCSSPTFRVQVKVCSLPEDLESNTKCLYAYNLDIVDVSNKTFVKYPELTHLFLIRVGLSSDYPKNALEPLKKLLILNITDMNWYENTEISFPINLKVLDITRMKTDTVMAPSLHSLEVLNVSGLRITEFPTVSDLAPLKLVVLHNVKLTNFKIDNFAKYCHIKELSTINMSLGNDNCKCLQWRAWMSKFDIKCTPDLKCREDSSCKLEFSETSLKNRQDCLHRPSAFKIWHLLVAAVVIFLVLMLVVSGFFYVKLRAQEEAEFGVRSMDEPITPTTPTTPANEVIEEETRSEDEINS